MRDRRYQTREVDCSTPAIGIALCALIIFLVGKTTMGL